VHLKGSRIRYEGLRAREGPMWTMSPVKVAIFIAVVAIAVALLA
jgi:hypothetical protein